MCRYGIGVFRLFAVTGSQYFVLEPTFRRDYAGLFRILFEKISTADETYVDCVLSIHRTKMQPKPASMKIALNFDDFSTQEMACQIFSCT